VKNQYPSDMTPNFTLAEFTASDKAIEWEIDNTPPWDVLGAILATCNGLERIMRLTGADIKILSGYRSKQLNAIVGGSLHSQHMRGQAADFVCHGYGSPKDIALLIVANKELIGFDQLIQENNRWIHISFTENPRFSVLTNSDVGYTPGLA